MCVLSHSVVFDSVSWTVGCQAPLSMKFSRQEHWGRLPFPTPGYLPDLRMEPTSWVLYHCTNWEAHNFYISTDLSYVDRYSRICSLRQFTLIIPYIFFPHSLVRLEKTVSELEIYVKRMRLPLFFSQSVQLLSHAWLFVTPLTAACQASLSITNSRSPPKAIFIELVMPSNHLILCWPLLHPPSIFPSIIYKWVSSWHHVAKVVEFQLQHWSFQWIFNPS